MSGSIRREHSGKIVRDAVVNGPGGVWSGLRRTVLFVAVANLVYFCVEFGAALSIDSVSLFADSVDFLEDASVNLLILLALGWTAAARARLGMVLAALLIVPAVAALWTIWRKFQAPTPPEPFLLSAIGFGALAVNLACARLLVRYRRQEGSLTKAAFLSARNDAIANVGIIAAGGLTLALQSGWPDIVVGLGIAAMNADAAFEVWRAARREAALDALPRV